MKKVQLIFCAFVVSNVALAQGTFQNLDFELAMVPDVPPDQYGGLVATTNAMPGWRAWSGTDERTVVPHNPQVLGSATPAILGPFRGPDQSQILQGNYSVWLNTGLAGSGGQTTSAGISQEGLIPSDAQSLLARVAVSDSAPYSVTFNGSPLSLVPIFAGPNYTLVGADVSSLAGQFGELRFTVFPTQANPINVVLLDDISFSPQSVPEPSGFGLFALGSLLLGWRFLKRTNGKC